MPKQKNIVQFSFNEEQLRKLKNLANEQESLGLCAKRLLLGIIESATEEIVNQRSEDLESRLKSLEYQLNDQFNDRLGAIELRVNSLKIQFDTDLDARNAFEILFKSWKSERDKQSLPPKSKNTKPKGFG